MRNLEIELVKVETRPGMRAWPEETTRDSSLGGPMIRIVNKYNRVPSREKQDNELQVDRLSGIVNYGLPHAWNWSHVALIVSQLVDNDH